VKMEIKKQNLGQIAPLSIGSGYLGVEESERLDLIKIIDGQYEKTSLPEGDTKAWTGDSAGYGNLQNHQELTPFFNKVGTVCKEYCEDIGVNPAKFKFSVARSWGTRSVIGQNISAHSHDYAHLSFVYYPKVSEDCGHLVFSLDAPPNEVIPGLFCNEGYECGIISYTNPNSINSMAYEPQEDLYLVFPAKTIHTTLASKSLESRYSIAADVILTLKDSETIELGLPCISEWIDV